MSQVRKVPMRQCIGCRQRGIYLSQPGMLSESGEK